MRDKSAFVDFDTLYIKGLVFGHRFEGQSLFLIVINIT